MGRSWRRRPSNGPALLPWISPADPCAEPIWVEADAAIDSGLEEWIQFAARFVGALPPDRVRPWTSASPDGLQDPFGCHGEAKDPSPGGVENRIGYRSTHVDDGGLSPTLGSQIVI